MKHITGRSGKYSATVENGFLKLFNTIDCNFSQRRFNIKDKDGGLLPCIDLKMSMCQSVLFKIN
jgi:hypothetical protein